jgi:hypothetical protein
LVIVLGMCVFTVLGVLGMNIGDSSSSETLDLLTGTTTTTTTTGGSVAPTLEVAAIIGGYVHGPNKFNTPSRDQACAVVKGARAGDEVQLSGSGGEGPLTVTGTVGAGGRVLAEGGISQYGAKTFTKGEVTDPSTGESEPLALPQPLTIDVQGGASKPCDPSSLPAAPSSGSSETPPPTEEPTAQAERVTVDKNGFPWSLVVAGGLDAVLLSFLFEDSSQPSEPSGTKTYPDYSNLDVV